jgi:hypothetical protein
MIFDPIAICMVNLGPPVGRFIVAQSVMNR